MSTIKPQTLKGFRDFLPSDMKIRQFVIDTFKRGFEKYGYEPLETPTLEYAQILLGKYGNEAEKLIYHFQDRGGREVAMKYDLTVPTCRVVAQYANQLTFPFKRYQIQPVWRADNTQKGRFREFYQCDADTIGSPSMVTDAEFIQMGLEIVSQLGFEKVIARINNRKFIDGLVQYAGATNEQFYHICIAVDKLEKIGIEGVREEMQKKGIDNNIMEKILRVIDLKGSPHELIATLSKQITNDSAKQGLQELEKLFSYLSASGVPNEAIKFDLSIIRGLSYYSGPVWEFTVVDGGVGSVAGCGRYDKLIGLYLGKDIPATGGSFGIERIIEIVKDRNLVQNTSSNQLLVTIFSPDMVFESIKIAQHLRQAGIPTILYPDENIKMEKQLKYANRKNIQYAIILGPEEKEKNVVKLKNMKTGEQKLIDIASLIKLLLAQT